MNDDLYASIGYFVVWCVKYIFVPFGVSISARYFADRILQPQPKKQRNKMLRIYILRYGTLWFPSTDAIDALFAS